MSTQKKWRCLLNGKKANNDIVMRSGLVRSWPELRAVSSLLLSTELPGDLVTAIFGLVSAAAMNDCRFLTID